MLSNDLSEIVTFQTIDVQNLKLITKTIKNIKMYN